MEQLLRYFAQRENMVCKLKKAIYDLKQSPRASSLSSAISSLKWVSRSGILIIRYSFTKLLLVL